MGTPPLDSLQGEFVGGLAIGGLVLGFLRILIIQYLYICCNDATFSYICADCSDGIRVTRNFHGFQRTMLTFRLGKTSSFIVGVLKRRLDFGLACSFLGLVGF